MRDVYIQRYARSTVEHYDFANVGFADIEGYEYYAGLAKNIEKHGLEKFNGFLADLQVWGTPDQVTAKLLDYVERTDAGAVLATRVLRRACRPTRPGPTSISTLARCCRRSRPTTSAATSGSPTTACRSGAVAAR